MTGDHLVVRRAAPGDADAIAAMYAQLVRNPKVAVLPERIAALSMDAHAALFVGEMAGRVCGTVLVCLCPDVMFNAQPFAVVENIVVDAEARGRGLGRALLRHVEAHCRAHDCSKIMLLSAAHREPAHRFFERAGYSGSSKRGFVKYRAGFEGPA